MQQEDIKQRLSKAISSKGYASRREAERLIESGRVKLNGKVVTEIVTFVTNKDIIEVDDIMLFNQKPKLWIYYKPAGLVTTHRDPEGRPTVFENIPLKLSHIISVGRLDIDSEGLLLITNSGELARKLELPSNNFKRTYSVKAYGNYNEEKLDIIRKGATIDGVCYKPAKVKLIKSNSRNHWFEVTVTEGKNREVRRLFEHIGLQINRLIRTSYHIYHLGDLPKGKILEVEIDEKILSQK